MEYKIIGKYDETYLAECLAILKFSSTEAIKTVKTFAICSAFYLAIGLLNYSRGKSTPLLISSIGVACFMLLILLLFNIYQSKTKTKQKLNTKIEKYKNTPTAERALLFTGNAVRFSDPEMLMELQWPAFSHYQENNNYVYFFLKESKKPIFSMDKNNIPESVKKDLFVLINSKISIKL